jgi:RNA polymerase sigma-70 factor (ECF subfamily)
MDQTLDTQRAMIALAQQGDTAAFERLIRPLSDRMLSVAAGLATHKHETDDIYQDAMLTAFRSIPSFKGQSQFSTWLYRVVVNTAISLQRKPSALLARLISKASGDVEVEDLEHYELDPEQQLANEQLSFAINKALNKLSKQERIAFVLCHQQELTINEAADVMQCSVGSVKSYLFRSREKMREQLSHFKGE